MVKIFYSQLKKTGIYVFNKLENISLGNRNINNLTTRNNFYDFHKIIQIDLEQQGILQTGNIDDEQYVEKKFFSYNIETKFATLLSSTIDTIKNNPPNNVLTQNQINSLSIHFAIQFFRTTSMRTLIIKILEAIKNYGVEKGIKDYNINVDEYKEIYHYLILSNQSSILKIAEDMSNRNWIIYKTPNIERTFVISDNPIVIQPVSKHVKGNYIIPLSSEYLLALYESGPTHNKVLTLNPLLNTIEEFNILQYQQCDGEVYSKLNDFSWIPTIPQTATGISKIRDSSQVEFDSYVAQIIEEKFHGKLSTEK